MEADKTKAVERGRNEGRQELIATGPRSNAATQVRDDNGGDSHIIVAMQRGGERAQELLWSTQSVAGRSGQYLK